MELNRYFDYDFDGDIESQADEIVHEAKDKLVDLIYENVKSEIEEDKKITSEPKKEQISCRKSAMNKEKRSMRSKLN